MANENLLEEIYDVSLGSQEDVGLLLDIRDNKTLSELEEEYGEERLNRMLGDSSYVRCNDEGGDQEKMIDRGLRYVLRSMDPDVSNPAGMMERVFHEGEYQEKARLEDAFGHSLGDLNNYLGDLGYGKKEESAKDSLDNYDEEEEESTEGSLKDTIDEAFSDGGEDPEEKRPEGQDEVDKRVEEILDEKFDEG